MDESRSGVGFGLLVGGLAYAVGGQLHPRGEGSSKKDYIASMLGQDSWAASHLLSLLGLVVIAVTFVGAYQTSAFGARVQMWVAAAAVGAGLGAIELLPHSAAAGELDSLENGYATPLLDLHLWLQMFATPAVGLTTAALAIAMARGEGTAAAKALAVVGGGSGVAYAFAGPLTGLTGGVTFVALFPAAFGIAVWYVGTGIRLLVRRPAPVRADLVGAR